MVGKPLSCVAILFSVETVLALYYFMVLPKDPIPAMLGKDGRQPANYELMSSVYCEVEHSRVLTQKGSDLFLALPNHRLISCVYCEEEHSMI